MRNVVCLASLLLLAAAASAQQDVINTVAGGGPNNLPGTSANVYSPEGVAMDTFGNYYFVILYSPEMRVFKVNSSGTLTVFAGNGLQGYSGDGGPATQAELNDPSGVAADSVGNVYIADEANCLIRKVDHTTGQISTFAGTPPVAGTPQCGYTGDGYAATSAQLNDPDGVAVDSSGNVYIADTENYAIREVTTDGNIHTVAGNGTECTSGGASCGDGGSATSAEISEVDSLAVDLSGYVYIADADNYSIRKFSVGGNISTVAGSNNGTECPEGGGTCGDGGPATSALLSDEVDGIAVDPLGNIFIADSDNYRIREVTVSGSEKIYTATGYISSTAGYIYDVAGSSTGSACSNGGAACGDGGLATSAGLSAVYGLAVDSSDNIFLADFDNIAIREVTASNGYINTVAGNGYDLFAGNGVPATNATLYQPTAATSDSSGNIYIADSDNCIVREVNATTGNITTFAGTPGVCGYGGDGSSATGPGAQLNYPSKAVVYQGNVYIADTDNCLVRMVDTSGTITTFAGAAPSGGAWHCGYGGDSGPATSATLSYPYGVAVDSSGNVYIADSGNNVVRKVSGGIINTVAGNGNGGYSGDGHAATSAMLYYPNDVAVDAAGNLYIADEDNNRIRMVNTAGIISTVAGNGSSGFSGDGVLATTTSLNYPEGVAVDAAGDVLIADMDNNRIRWVDGRGFIYTVAGNGTYGFSGDGGLGTSAELAYPEGVGLDPSANIYVTDTSNYRVRKVNAVAGLNASMTSLTFGPQALGTFSGSQSVTLTAVGALSISNIAVTGDFSQTGTCTTGPMSGQCVMNIKFKPTAAGTRTGAVTISDNGYFSSSLMINLSGTGASVLLSPNPLVFAAQGMGATSAPQTLTATNYLSRSLTLSATVGGANARDFTVQIGTCRYPTTQLGANSSCTYHITFRPSVNGAESATLSISDAGGTQTATLEGTGVGAALSPATLTFAAQKVGTTSGPQRLTLTNYLRSLLSFRATITGANPGDFAVQRLSSTCGYPSGWIVPYLSCTYEITFKPSASGPASATLSVVDAAGTQTATLSGTGK
jgi:sugar lactone lactonase YvrE